MSSTRPSRPDRPATPAPPADRGLVLSGLAERFAGPLERFFLRRVRNKADAADLVQDVFLRISSMADPRGIERPEHFLFVTAANVLKDQARRDKVRAAGLHDDIADHDIADTGFPADRVLAGREAARALDATLRLLPERTRDVFVLRMLEGWRMADVADALGISTRAAEKHQAKALARVTAALLDWR